MAEKEKEEGAASPPPPKKGGSKTFLIVAVLAVVGVFAGGVFAGPKIGQKLHVPGYSSHAIPADEVPPAAGIMTIESCVIDLRSKQGDLHHLKLGLVIELNKELHEKELAQAIPRARDATISYMRSLEYEKVTQPDEFEQIRKELDHRIAKAVGERDVSRVLFTDFVVQ